MKNRKFEFVLFDMIGTTVKDSPDGDSLIIDCFSEAFSLNGFQVTFDEINQQRGRSKREAIRNIISTRDNVNDLTAKVYIDFIGLINKSLTDFKEIYGTSALFEQLIGKGIKIGLGSGLPMEIVTKIIEHLGWRADIFDYIGSSEEFGKGRPDPVMINDALLKLKMQNRLRVLKIGDTASDILEGKNAGVNTAAVLSGTFKREELEKYDPDYIFSDIREVMTIIQE